MPSPGKLTNVGSIKGVAGKWLNSCLLMSTLLLIYPVSLAQQKTNSPGWEPVGLPGVGVTSIALDPENDSIIFVGSPSDFSASSYGGVYRSTNEGIFWTKVLDSVSVQVLLIDAYNPRRIFAGLGDANGSPSGLMRSEDGGDSWIRSDSGIGALPVSAVAFGASSREIYLGTGYAFSGDLFKSNDGGTSWNLVSDLSAEPVGFVTCICIHPAEPSAIFVFDNYAKIYRSFDSGLSWTSSPFPYGRVYQCAYGDNPGSFILATGSTPESLIGLVKTTDRGDTWSSLGGKLPYNSGYATSVVVDSTENNLYIAGRFYVDGGVDSGEYFGVYSTTNEGDSWDYLGLDTSYYYSLAISPSRRTLYAGLYWSSLVDVAGLYRLPIVTATEEAPVERQDTAELSTFYPNPFNANGEVEVYSPLRQDLVFEIYSITGQLIRRGAVESVIGKIPIRWNGTDEAGNQVSSGIYLMRVLLGSDYPRWVMTTKIVFQK